MCDNTIGPATIPSLVTWPTIRNGMLRVFASLTKRDVAYLTCPTDPDKPSKLSDSMVWMESIITREGLIFSTISQIASVSVRDISKKLEAGRVLAILFALIPICSSDSSPEIYKTELISLLRA